MKAYKEVQCHSLLTSVLVAGEWTASWACSFTPRKRVPGNYLTGGLVGYTAGLKNWSCRNIS